MKQKLSFKEYIYVASMLFGMFFGAGNLIFPVYMGQVAGRNMWAAVLGFLITGVGLPLLGVAALGISRSNGLFDLSHKVGRPYAFFFTCALYLTIGPFFAIPRCATTSFTVGLEQILPHDDKSWLYLLLFVCYYQLDLSNRRKGVSYAFFRFCFRARLRIPQPLRGRSSAPLSGRLRR